MGTAPVHALTCWLRVRARVVRPSAELDKVKHEAAGLAAENGRLRSEVQELREQNVQAYEELRKKDLAWQHKLSQHESVLTQAREQQAKSRDILNEAESRLLEATTKMRSAEVCFRRGAVCRATFTHLAASPSAPFRAANLPYFLSDAAVPRYLRARISLCAPAD